MHPATTKNGSNWLRRSPFRPAERVSTGRCCRSGPRLFNRATRCAQPASGERVPHRPRKTGHVRALQRLGVDEEDAFPQRLLAVAGPGDLRDDPAVRGPTEERRVGIPTELGRRERSVPLVAADEARDPRAVGWAHVEVATETGLFALVRDEATARGKRSRDPRKRPV